MELNIIQYFLTQGLENTIFKFVIASLGSIGSYLFGGLNSLIEILIVFVLIDYISGIIAAGVEGRLQSNKEFKGITKKVMIFIMISIVHLTDTAIVDQHFIRDAAIFLYLRLKLG
ncbi:holin family protein [Chengkuizengella sp. SCS-71B]|uniref:phage holin family protein n=1 Tax=Chengkuizengella sp. SCS-71B TaxID=3115290 RepID=UPI0032C23EC8